MTAWFKEGIVYHAYALGYCGAPPRNDRASPPVARLDELTGRLDAIRDLGATVLLVGPVWESGSHGYDTIDYLSVDRRLGVNDDLRRLVEEAGRRGIAIMLDAVLNHVGREHPWFKDLRERGQCSAYASYFSGIDFSRQSPAGDAFSYEGWSGHYDLVKLDHRSPELAAELIDTVRSWIRDYGIAGLRLDAADVIDRDFLARLAEACRAERPGFCLMGEMVHGDYRELLGRGRLDSVTNYECYKGLWSSLRDANYFEIAYALKRQFGPGGIYERQPLFNFTDNHDVDRVASSLGDPRLLYPLYGLVFSMPGVPSLYYGSEYGARGKRNAHGDGELRRPIREIEAGAPEPDLPRAIKLFAETRRSLPELSATDYEELHVAHRSLAFRRGPSTIVALNAGDTAATLGIRAEPGTWRDALDPGYRMESQGGTLRVDIPPYWTRWLVRER